MQSPHELAHKEIQHFLGENWVQGLTMASWVLLILIKLSNLLEMVFFWVKGTAHER